MPIKTTRELEALGKPYAGIVKKTYEAGARGMGGYQYGTPALKAGWTPPSTEELLNRQYDTRSNFQKFTDWTGSVGSTAGGVVAGAGKILGNAAASTATNLVSFAARNPYFVAPVSPALLIPQVKNKIVSENEKALGRMMNEAQSKEFKYAYENYKNGNISKEEYDRQVKEATKKDQLLNKVESYTHGKIYGHDLSTTERIINDIDAALTAASLGTFGMGKAMLFESGEKLAAKVAGRKMILEEMDDATKYGLAFKKTAQDSAEDMVATVWNATQKVPGWQQFTAREMAKIGNSYGAKRLLANAALEVAVMAPLRRENMRMVVDVYDQLRAGNWLYDDGKIGAIPESLLIASMALRGGPIGFLADNVKKGGGALRTAMFGEGTQFFDEVYKHYGSLAGKPMYVANAVSNLRRLGSKADNESLDEIMKVVQGTNVARRGVVIAAQEAAEATFAKLGKDAEDWQILQDMVRYFKLFQKADKFGAVVTRFDRATQAEIAGKIEKALKTNKFKGKTIDVLKERAKEVVKNMAKGAYWNQNQQILEAMLNGIDNAKDIDGIYWAIKNRATYNFAKLPKQLVNELADNGYVGVMSDKPIASPLMSAERASNQVLKSAYVPVDDAMFEQAAVAKPYFRAVGSALRKVGLSLEDTAAEAYRTVRANAEDYIGKMPGFDTKKAKNVIGAIQEYAESGSITRPVRRTVTDVRMMSYREVETALAEAGIKVSRTEAKSILKAIIKAHIDAPLQLKGLANAVTDKLYGIPAWKFYPRLQGALRYTYNPFFRVQEITETELLGQMVSGGKQAWMPGMGALRPDLAKHYDEISAKLAKIGIFDDAMRAVEPTMFGEAATDVMIGRVTANIVKSQKRSMAAVVDVMRKKYKMSVDDLLKYHAAEVSDFIRPIVQYPSKGALNTNFAKALNLAVFPARYNIKVTAMTVKALSQLPAMQQTLVVNKLWEMSDWVNSPEGIQWRMENSEAIGLFKWLTPVGNIQWVFDILGMPFGRTKGAEGLGDLGIIGGLPLGVITQILESQGVMQINTPYINPKDGDIYSKRIPESMKARMASAFTDLLGSTFTYPGRTLGMPGKGAALRGIAQLPFGTTSAEWGKINYTNADLPAWLAREQEIMQKIAGKNGESVTATPGSSPQAVPTDVTGLPDMPDTRDYSKTELNELKKKAAAAKAAAKKRSKTATFPSNLPQ